MREILFRGKRIDNGEWVEGYLLLCDERVFILPWGVVGCWHFDWLKKGEYIFGKFIEVIPETIGQYTGLTDKNGKRIFEGDIVAQSWYDFDEPADDSFGEVVYVVGDCSFSVLDNNKNEIISMGQGGYYHWEAEIIGNIHDNSEWLKGDNNV